MHLTMAMIHPESSPRCPNLISSDNHNPPRPDVHRDEASVGGGGGLLDGLASSAWRCGKAHRKQRLNPQVWHVKPSPWASFAAHTEQPRSSATLFE